MAATRYAIHMETGVIVPMTAETLNNYIYQEIDPEAFITVTKIKEVRGRGFTTERKPLEIP